MAIRARKLSNGKTVYDVSIYETTEHRRSQTVSTKREAVQLEAQWIALRDNLRRSNPALTLKEYIDKRYWPNASKRLSASSKDTYEKHIRLRIKPALGNYKLRDIDRAIIQSRMVDGCATDGVARDAVGVLKTILNEAIADGFISKNPACAKFAYPSTPSRPRDNGIVLPTFAQIYRLLAVVDSASVPVQRIAYTGLLLGLRPEERYGLDWRDFDLTTQTVTISRACITASPLHGGVQLKETKTRNSTRTIPLHPVFSKWISTQPRGNSQAFILGADGNRISPSTAQKWWRDFLATHPDVPPVTIENMRHSFATAYLDAGGKVEILSRILGHSNISTTVNKYFRPDVELLRNDLLSMI